MLQRVKPFLIQAQQFRCIFVGQPAIRDREVHGYGETSEFRHASDVRGCEHQLQIAIAVVTQVIERLVIVADAMFSIFFSTIGV